MVVYQYLNNLAYVAALLIPYPFVCGKLTGTGMENFEYLIEVYIQYINIFFITGIIYLSCTGHRCKHINPPGNGILRGHGCLKGMDQINKQHKNRRLKIRTISGVNFDLYSSFHI